MAKKQANHADQAQEGTKATPSKTEAVKEAITQGMTSPTEIVAHVNGTYGLDVTPNHVSMIKTALKRKGTIGRKRGRPKGSTKKAVAKEVAPAPAKAVSAAKGGSLTPQDLRLLTTLARQAGGIAQLREYLDVLGNVR